MKLKSLDIKGFKSFADKTQIILDNSITGIVGPNGCGKSNIIDAIRWVIGEHKIKSLRSDNLQDLIFNGSKSRSASGMAEVSLTFENTRNLLPTEFTTVTITRKFFRSGDSEYRLNDVVCRLKDIHNLFLDTGVSNDSYAIIELGMVDDIIKDKDGSRRRMLEQAAGISIYKTRKKEAKLKLDATQQDLARVDDLMFEIGNNLKTLESQARKAEKYLQVKKEYKETSIELAKASLTEFNEKYQLLQEKLETEQDKKLKIETEIAGDEAEIEANKVTLVHKEQELSLLQKKFNELLNSIRHLESEKKLAAQRLDYLQEREKNLHLSIQQSQQTVEQIQNNISQNKEQIIEEEENTADLRYELDELQETLAEKRIQYDSQKSNLQEKKDYLIAFQRKQFDAEKKVAVADSSVLNIQRNIQQLLDEQAQRNNQVSSLQQQRTTIEQAISEKQYELEALITQFEQTKEQIAVIQSQLEQEKNKLQEELRILDAKKNEHSLIQSMVDSLEGFPDSIKYLKKNKEWQNNATLLSDVFIVKDAYKKALENILDNYLNYFVIDNIQDGTAAIKLLQNNKKGKANFIIKELIPAIQGTPINQKDLIPALNVVTTDAQYQHIADYLLHHVYITQDALAFDTTTLPKGSTIVNIDGSIIMGNHILSGGSVGLFEGNKIGRAKNLEKLAAEITHKSSITEQLKKEIANLQVQATALHNSLNEKSIDQCKQAFQHLQQQQHNIANKLENFEQQNQNAEQRITQYQDQLLDTQDNISDTRAALDSFNTELQQITSTIQAAEAAFTQVEQDFNGMSRQYNDLNINLTRQQSKIEHLRQELQFRENQIKDAHRQIDQNKSQIIEIANQISDTSGKLHFGDNELYDYLKKKEQDEIQLNALDHAYYGFRNEIAAHENKISKQRKEKEQAETLLNGLRDKLNEMKLQVAGLKERLSVEFRVDLNDILEEARTGELSVDQLNEEAERLKKRLDNMGEINPTAIEAYNEIKVRHDFIAEQKQDLEDARNTLLDTISEVEQTANAKFKETFDLVRANFVHVFKALFTEDDNADLRLTDPENVADSGIEIYAQPKGKRPSTLTQLSGGEKTLTSTAFLFAIYLIKPAPFCILDEVDAPLDDANVGKFTQMIRKFSDNSQFIIVTHNKQTMSAVDVIYGVTMQEAGVSKLVPVDFRNLEA